MKGLRGHSVISIYKHNCQQCPQSFAIESILLLFTMVSITSLFHSNVLLGEFYFLKHQSYTHVLKKWVTCSACRIAKAGLSGGQSFNKWLVVEGAFLFERLEFQKIARYISKEVFIHLLLLYVVANIKIFLVEYINIIVFECISH